MERKSRRFILCYYCFIKANFFSIKILFKSHKLISDPIICLCFIYCYILLPKNRSVINISIKILKITYRKFNGTFVEITFSQLFFYGNWFYHYFGLLNYWLGLFRISWFLCVLSIFLILFYLFFRWFDLLRLNFFGKLRRFNVFLIIKNL